MNIKFVGNGDSKQNAIYFTNAKTFNDYIEMQHQYVENHDLKVNNVKSYGSVKDEYMYDIYETENGNVWFKVPNNFVE